MIKNLEKRQELAELYDSLLKNVPGITKPAVRENSVHARHLYPIWVDSAKRDSTIEKLIERGIGVVVNYRAIHLLTYFKNNFGFRPGQFPHAERIGDQTISLPFYPNMPKDQVEYVVRTLKELV